ncbi:MAG: peptidoglycan-binding protein, partial [Candidatus Pacebacteria bacterium]|nr:peptidoglycan-binding protein [Candidatus Paceibacterota bacterium]
GKVNQHIDANGTWQTDPDGVSGANLDKLTYCKKWFPNTTSVEDYKLETITTWRERGNVNAWTSTKMSTKCIQGNSSLGDETTLDKNNKEKKNKDCSASVFSQTIKLYSKGDDVRTLQTVLSDHGYLSLADVDGSFGPKTKEALIAFQIDNNLVGDGIAGPITRGVLKTKWQAQCLVEAQQQ